MLSFKTTIFALAIGTVTMFAGTTFGDTPATSGCEMCKPTAVKVSVTNDKGRLIGEKTVTKMNCPECSDAITTLLNTGKFEHSCSMPGVSKDACQH